MLTETCPDIGEVRFKAGRVEQRPLGFFGPNPGEFTLLFWAVEKNDQLKPRGACDSAQARRRDAIRLPDERTHICGVGGTYETLDCQTEE